MGRILVTYPLPGEGIELLKKAGHEVTVRETNGMSKEELTEAVGSYDAIISLLTNKLDKEVLDTAGPQLKIIANYAVGYDNIDVAAGLAKNIIITNTPEVLSAAVAEHAMALLLAVSRRIVESDRFMRAGKYDGWKPDLLLGTELSGKTLGIVGVGRIGKDVAERAHHGFKMKIVYQDLKPSPELEKDCAAKRCETVEELLMEVDAVSIHVPLLPQTKHLLNTARLALLKPTAIVINTSRGPVIDEKALVKALQNKQIGGAGLDVFEEEPKMAPGLSELDNVVLTPHTASATMETRSAMSKLAAENVIAVLEGKPPLTPVKPPEVKNNPASLLRSETGS